MSILQNSNAISAGGYDVNNSLRFRGSASASLTRTPTLAGNTKTFTISAWLKRGSLTTTQAIITQGSGNRDIVRIGSDNLLYFYYYDGSTYVTTNTSQVFRDPSAWYHIVIAVDTTQATAANRIRMYVNGNQITAFANANYPSQNYNFIYWNGTTPAAIGKDVTSNSDYLDGYLADFNFIDGSAKTPSDFGETDTTTGVWKPKAYTSTYGTNGFYLKFSDIATTSGSNAGLGKDFSGNANYWTTNNISVTAGTTYDAMTDVPTNTSATVANYCVMNAAAPYGAFLTLSEANLKSTCNGAYWAASPATFGVSSGKWYWEVFITNKVSSVMVGITKDTDTGATTGQNVYPGISANSYGYVAGGLKYNNATGTSYGATYTTNDIIGVALDLDAGTLTYYKNNTSQGTAFSGLSGTYLPSIGVNDTNTAVNANFGQRPFSYTPPTGFVALNTFNLPTPTILQGNKYMDATIYSGNSSSQSIVNAGAFKPDMIWFKNRNSTENNAVFDTLRPLTTALRTNSTIAEYTNTDTDDFVSYNSNGFSLNGNGDTLNFSSKTYVAWQWQAGQGSTTTGTGTGGITSVSYSVSTTAGFSVVIYTGSGSVGTVTHGLGVAPSMIICKPRSAVDGWMSYHSALGNTKYILLNTTAAAAVGSGAWNNTSPTSSVFTIGTSGNVNTNGVTMVAYCWAAIPGYSAFTSYTGNGSSDGVFVYLGFRPKYIMIKSSSIAGEWAIYDSNRGLYNPNGSAGGRLQANTSNAETGNDSAQYIDFLSNGFKIRNTSGFDNQSGATYIVAAWAENPFKNSLAR